MKTSAVATPDKWEQLKEEDEVSFCIGQHCQSSVFQSLQQEGILQDGQELMMWHSKYFDQSELTTVAALTQHTQAKTEAVVLS